jgi:hypothetical protein
MRFKEYTVRVYADGTKYWCLNGKFHREDGPAMELANGVNYWYLDDEQCTEAEFKAKMAPAKEMTVAEIEALLGYRLKIVKDNA